MKIALDNADGVNIVTTYEPGRVQIRSRHFTTSLIVFPDRLLPDWRPRSPDELRAGDLNLILEMRPEVVLLGSGDTQIFPDPATFIGLMDVGIGFEIMHNAAACRTYNVLLAEQRRVALALLLGTSDS